MERVSDNTESVKYNKEKRKENKKQTKKGTKNILNNWINFYKEELMKKHLIVFVLMVIFFALVLSSALSVPNNITDSIKNAELLESIKNINIFKDVIQEKILVVILIVLSGFTPFLYLPIVISPLVSYNFATKIASIMSIEGHSYTLLPMLVSSVLQLVVMSLAVAVGLYYTKRATKRFRYSQSKNYSFNDIKLRWYDLRKQTKKVEELKDRESKKREEKEKLNVKIDYSNMFITIILSVLVITIFSFISIV